LAALKLLAHVPDLDETVKAQCGYDLTRMTRAGQPVLKEARFPYFAAGYVDIDLPRDMALTYDIHEATKGFAIADENGNVLGKFKTIANAEKARASAKIKLDVSVDVDESDEEAEAE
jgi:hypothetical protein